MTEKDCKGILVFAEQKKEKIHRVSYELLGKGKELAAQLDCPLCSVVLGPPDMDVAELIYRGADIVYHITDPMAFAAPDEVLYEQNLVRLIRDIKPEICLFGATNFGRSLAPRVAAKLGAGLTADCTHLAIDQGQLMQIRPAFSENILAHIQSTVYPQMATVRYKEFNEAPRDTNRKGQIKAMEAYVSDNSPVKILEEIVKEDFDIADANVVVAAGAGVKAKEDLKMLQELAELLGGKLGASRAAVEAGLIAKDHQVGYSGNRVKPSIYIACGISGAPQHIAGMKESGIIIAINSDPSAPILNIADYAIVGNLYEIIPKMIRKLKNMKS